MLKVESFWDRTLGIRLVRLFIYLFSEKIYKNERKKRKIERKRFEKKMLLETRDGDTSMCCIRSLC